jgi:hypothetical protein
MRTLVDVLSLVSAMLLAACGEKVNVNVSCVTTADPAVECTLVQTKGKSLVKVCWDFTATCANGAVVTAPHICHTIKDGGTEKLTVHADSLTGIDKCAGSTPPTAKLSNMTIDGKATESQ